MRNSSLIVAPAITPRKDNAALAFPACFYRIHEGAAAAIADSLGFGGDLTLAGSGTGTPWANVGWLTPDGTNHYAQSNSNSNLRSIFRLDQAYGVIYHGIDFWWDGGCTGPEALVIVGTSDNVVGCCGVTINSSSQVVLTTRGIGASNHTDTVFSGFSLAGYANQRVSLVVEIIYKTATTCDANLYVNGSAASSVTNVNLVANSATAVFGSVEKNTADNQAYTLGAQPNGIGARARLLNSAASNGRIARWWASRHATRDTTLGLALALALYRYQGEFPACMNSAT